MQPFEASVSDSGHPAPIGHQLPSTQRRGPRLVLSVDASSLAASQTRHLSSQIDPLLASRCGDRGFVPPSRDGMADALRRLPSTWRDVLRRGRVAP